ncbi:MAG: DegV family protein, partial [Bacillota bacterium]
MSQVSVVTDSVSDLPDDLIEKYGITMVPAIVRFSPQEELKDREDISIAKFMERLAQGTEPVRTSQPSPGAFVEAFRKAGQDGRPVISVQPSAKFSGTYQSACIARDILAEEGYRIEVVDTRLASMGQGWAVIEAARAALAGLPLDKVAERVKTVSSKVKIVLSVDTLTYLYRNGRLGRVQALLGSLLQLKPILSVRDGEL